MTLLDPPTNKHIMSSRLPVLDETDVGGLLAEALTADVESVLADETGLVGADTALPASLSVGAGTGVPNVLVSHVG